MCSSSYNYSGTFQDFILDSEHLIYRLHVNAQLMHNVINLTFLSLFLGQPYRQICINMHTWRGIGILIIFVIIGENRIFNNIAYRSFM